MSDPAPQFCEMSEEDYLRTEPDSPIKREFMGGYVYPLHGPTVAQAGASSGHGRLSLKIAALLLARAEASGCSVYTSDMRLNATSPTGKRVYYYPDVIVTCESVPNEANSVREPCVLVEVLSPSTGHTDRNDKLWAYTSLPSLQTYLIVDATQRFVRVIQRTPTGWEETEQKGGTLALPCLNMSLTLDDIYAGVIGG